MAWWRRRKPTHASPPVRRQATWCAPALPPELEEAIAVAVAASPPVLSDLPASPDPTSPFALPEQRSATGVRLGFTDGSQLDLPVEDPRARALRAVADYLVQDPAAGTERPSRFVGP